MPQSVERVEGEWGGEDKFPCSLDTLGDSCDNFDDVRTAEGSWGDKVSDGETVKQDTEADTSHTIGNGSNPGELWLIDGEVRAAGTL